MRHIRRATSVAIALAFYTPAMSCSDSTVGPPTPAAVEPAPATHLAGAEADSALALQAKLRAAHGDSALLSYLVETGSLWKPDRGGRRRSTDGSSAGSLRRQLDEFGPSRNLTWNGSSYDWDGTIPQEDMSPASIITVTRDAGSPTPYVPGYASATVLYHGDVARNNLKWNAVSTYGTSVASGEVAPEGTGDYLCDEPGTANGEAYPYSWGGLACRYHRFTTYVPIHTASENECGVTVTASGSAHAWKAWPFGIRTVSIRGVLVTLGFESKYGSSGEVGAPTVTSEPLPCETEQNGQGQQKSSGPQTTTATSWPEVSVAYWDPPVYHPEITIPDGPTVYGVWCQVTYTFQYGRLIDAVGKCYAKEGGM